MNSAGGTTALNGWGRLAAGLLVAFLLVELVTARRGRTVAAVLAIAASSVAVVEFFTGSARVIKIAGIVAVSTEHTLWPAYAVSHSLFSSSSPR